MFYKCLEIWKAQTVIDDSRSESVISTVPVVTVMAVAIFNILREICQPIGDSVFVMLCTDDGELLDATAT